MFKVISLDSYRSEVGLCFYRVHWTFEYFVISPSARSHKRMNILNFYISFSFTQFFKKIFVGDWKHVLHMPINTVTMGDDTFSSRKLHHVLIQNHNTCVPFRAKLKEKRFFFKFHIHKIILINKIEWRISNEFNIQINLWWFIKVINILLWSKVFFTPMLKCQRHIFCSKYIKSFLFIQCWICATFYSVNK